MSKNHNFCVYVISGKKTRFNLIQFPLIFLSISPAKSIVRFSLSAKPGGVPIVDSEENCHYAIKIREKERRD